MTSCGLRTLCDGPETPTQWKSESGSNLPTYGDGYASKNTKATYHIENVKSSIQTDMVMVSVIRVSGDVVNQIKNYYDLDFILFFSSSFCSSQSATLAKVFI